MYDHMTSGEQPLLPVLLAHGFVVQLTTSKELALAEPGIPLIAVAFRGRCQTEGDLATWSVVLDYDQARDLATVLSGAICGGSPAMN